ncbi:MAG: glycosyltransferase family 2 protein [Gammaproteobacteria bacterium]|jgi:glycosyltransferase involved in cell wall biosynthesis|nr:glycosyltransferase family 2 protein [Gammaproteobacteria bacterium]MDP6617734.1 glycosyltransferase family 2 protein [Gammaproteobacteria bacterium]MDP6694120.1 glycosyltransferase family 2 protein [Gammaproteobacteria bacterium]
MDKRYTLSVTLITLNEADRVERCLESVSNLADEIIVFDSGSTDGTLDIVARYTDKIWKTDWPGFGKQKQRALEQASCDWVLAIDADEALDETMQQSVTRVLSEERGDLVALKMPWAVMLYGKRLDHGRSARAPLRMVWREGASFTDVEVHETLLHQPGTKTILEGRLLHFTHRDYGHGVHKSVEYAWLGSQKYFRQGKRCHTLLSPIVRSMWTFFLIYILRGGFLDGSVGLLAALSYAQNNYNKYAGLWTLTRMEKLERNKDRAP